MAIASSLQTIENSYEFEEGLKRGYTVKIQDEQCIGNRKGICAKSGINKACVILLSVMLAYGSEFYPPFGNTSNLKVYRGIYDAEFRMKTYIGMGLL